MPYTMEDFRHDTAKAYLPYLSLEERLHDMPIEEIENYLKRRKGVPSSEPKQEGGQASQEEGGSSPSSE